MVYVTLVHLVAHSATVRQLARHAKQTLLYQVVYVSAKAFFPQVHALFVQVALTTTQLLTRAVLVVPLLQNALHVTQEAVCVQLALQPTV